MRALIFLVLGALVCGVQGCNAPANLQLTTAPVHPEPRTTVAGQRQLHLLPVVDERHNQDQLGKVAGRRFTSDDLTEWVNVALRDSLQTEGFVSDPTAELTLQPRICKAYVDNVDIAKTAVFVMEFNYTVRGETESRTYRGQDAVLNWGSGKAEVTASLQRALQKCIRQMIVEVRARTYRAINATGS